MLASLLAASTGPQGRHFSDAASNNHINFSLNWSASALALTNFQRKLSGIAFCWSRVVTICEQPQWPSPVSTVSHRRSPGRAAIKWKVADKSRQALAGLPPSHQKPVPKRSARLFPAHDPHARSTWTLRAASCITGPPEWYGLAAGQGQYFRFCWWAARFTALIALYCPTHELASDGK